MPNDPTNQRPIIIWLRQDLRLGDHPALHEAMATGRPVLHGYVFDNFNAQKWAPGGASRWWLHHSLQDLNASLTAIGGRLVLRSGDTLRELAALASEVDAQAVYWTRAYEPYQVALEAKLEQALAGQGIVSRCFGGTILFEPETISTAGGTPFRVFTPFWKACRQRSVGLPVARPDRIRSVRTQPPSLDLKELALLPDKPDWSGGLRDSWVPGEQAARLRLQEFIERSLIGYDEDRNRPDLAGTSKLSPSLQFGEISVREVWHEIEMLTHADSRVGNDGVSLLRELVWRDFSHHLLVHFPSLPDQPFREQFERFPWRSTKPHLHAWKRGLTGYPLVDAGMRQLWHTGWMHNRVRMVAASFLTKHLLIPWQEGEAWFWDTLVDANLANNAASWQWVAGCGADAAPYFRIFNPVLQGQKFDPQGEYVRRWIPELGRLPSRTIHQPWNTPSEVLRAAGVRLGEDYPIPVVDHSTARNRALEAYSSIRS